MQTDPAGEEMTHDESDLSHSLEESHSEARHLVDSSGDKAAIGDDTAVSFCRLFLVL